MSSQDTYLETETRQFQPAMIYTFISTIITTDEPWAVKFNPKITSQCSKTKRDDSASSVTATLPVLS